jgi:hypothetical protein
MAWTSDPADLAVEVLNGYYRCEPSNAHVGPRGDEAVDRELLPDRAPVIADLLEASARRPLGAAS